MVQSDQTSTGAPSEALRKLREEIDRIDIELLRLVEQRLEVSAQVGAVKTAEGEPYLRLRPGREQVVIERLTAQAKRASPELIRDMWRALMAHSVQAQRELEILVCAEKEPGAIVECTRVMFGSAAPIRLVATAEEALRAARQQEAVAVIEEGVQRSLADGEMVREFAEIRANDGRTLAHALGRVPEA